ncbi:kinase-like domain-containing protein [Paraphoma chrysanthemicola]|nr:kinase-like domain-containing protein [Paraphoma chrysanthemicola]
MLSIVPRSRPSASDLVNILRERGPILFSLPEFPPGCSLTTRVDPQKLVTGWQLGGKQFLWEEDAQTVLEVTSRGVLGRGQTAEVEEVRVPGSNVTLARKRVAISRAKTLGGLEKKRIRAEIEIIRSLDHQHIVKVIGCYQKPRGRYIADLCVLLHPAADSDLQVFLGERCKNASHTERGWLGRWFTCLSSALAYLHYHGIHHEDIKPGNIVHRGRDIYFTDFSSSRRVISWDETSTESPAVATRLYAAPEAMSSGSQMLRHGSQSDVYSLGLVFVEMLTVLMLHQIGGLRAFLFSKPGDKHQYHHVTHKMGMWFEESHAVKPLSVFVLSNMLAANRRERVSAQTVADYFVHSETLFNMGSCGCHWLRWERPKGITGPRDCTNTNPELCGCTNAEPEPRDGTNIEADDDFVIV